MKNYLLALFVIFITLSALALKKEPEYRKARREGAEMKVVLHVVDDKGTSVTNASVNVFMGMNFEERSYSIKGETDTSGRFVVAGKTCGDKIVVDISKEGYYKSHKKYCFATMGAEHKVKDGKWQPYGAEERIKLRKICQPANLICFDDIMKVPVTNRWIGLDFERKDFVKPYGVGMIADIEIKVEWDGLPAWKSQYCSLDMRFASARSGGYYEENITESIFPYPYRANPNKGYSIKLIHIVNRAGIPNQTRLPFSQDKTLVTQSRVTTKGEPHTVFANYGSIRKLEIGPGREGKALLVLSYAFNPTPNDTNLETNE